KGHLGVVGSLAHVSGVGDDRLRRPGLDDERIPIGVVDVDRPLDDPPEVGHPEEAKSDRLLRETLQKGPDPRLIVRAYRPDVDRRAVPQYDVRLALVRI